MLNKVIYIWLPNQKTLDNCIVPPPPPLNNTENREILQINAFSQENKTKLSRLSLPALVLLVAGLVFGACDQATNARDNGGSTGGTTSDGYKHCPDINACNERTRQSLLKVLNYQKTKCPADCKLNHAVKAELEWDRYLSWRVKEFHSPDGGKPWAQNVGAGNCAQPHYSDELLRAAEQSVMAEIDNYTH